MKYIINGKIIMPHTILENKALVYGNKIIDIIDPEKVPENADVLDAGGGYISPGLIDIHIHGYLGADVSDGNADGIKLISQGIIKNGITSWCPTTMTVSQNEIITALNTVRSLKSDSKNWNGAEILGVNLEGPFINPEKKGAQAEEHIKPLDPQFIIDNADIIALTTVAPEINNNLTEIEKIVKKCNVKVAIGHSNASFEESIDAINVGATHITHLFNAQTPLNHRNPGVVGAALTTDVSCELICDTFHIHKDLFSLIAKLKKEKLVLITDCTRAGGLGDGEYTLGGQKIIVNGVKCLLTDGTIAGSVLKLNCAVKNMWENTNIPLYEIVSAASLNAAMVIGEDKRKGSLEVGKDADIIITDADFNVLKTIINGRQVY